MMTFMQVCLKKQLCDPEMIPISSIVMGNASERNNIVITEESYKELLKIRQITTQTNQEEAYIIFGEEKSNGTVWLDAVTSSYKPFNTTSADFYDINKALNDYVKGIQSWDFNFMMYENNPNEGFYTFPTVCLRHEDGTADLLPAYQNGNYIRKDNEFGSK